MAADKVYRVLSMYMQMQEGGVIIKGEAAERYDVNERSIIRDIVDIREFLEKKSLRTGSGSTVVFDRSRGGYCIKDIPSGRLTKNGLLVMCKILADSGAFGKDEIDAILEKMMDCCSSDEGRGVIAELIAEEQRPV